MMSRLWMSLILSYTYWVEDGELHSCGNTLRSTFNDIIIVDIITKVRKRSNFQVKDDRLRTLFFKHAYTQTGQRRPTYELS